MAEFEAGQIPISIMDHHASPDELFALTVRIRKARGPVTAVASLCRQWSRCRGSRWAKSRRENLTPQRGCCRRNPRGRIEFDFMRRHFASMGFLFPSLPCQGPNAMHRGSRRLSSRLLARLFHPGGHDAGSHRPDYDGYHTPGWLEIVAARCGPAVRIPLKPVSSGARGSGNK